MALTEHMGKLLDAAHEAYVRAYGRTLVQFGDRHAMGIKAAVEAVLADQARAAEQGQACKHVHPLRQNSTGNGVEYHCADCGVLIGQEPDCLCCGHSYSDHLGTVPVGSDATPCIRCSCVEYHKNPQPAQPAAGDVVERVMSRGCPISCSNDLGHSYTCLREHVTAALAVAREGYVSLEDVEAAIESELHNRDFVYTELDRQMILRIAKRVRARLAKPAEHTDEQKVEAILINALKKLSTLGNGEHPGNSLGNEIAQKALTDAIRLREELKAGKQ